jgi:simple sugar transport system substrate-binding protein
MTTPAEPTLRRRKDHSMFRSRKRTAALIAGLALITTACSSTGGKQEEAAAPGANAGKANTPEMTVQMVTHAGPGQTFWDIERKGGEAAAAKDNIKLQYSSDPDSGKQATLIQSAIDAKVDAIAVTLPDPSAIGPAVKKAVDAGIPVVAFNAGIGDYQKYGALSYFGSDESVAGEAAGKRASDDGYKHVLCVIHAQGRSSWRTAATGSTRPSPASTPRSTSTARTCPR